MANTDAWTSTSQRLLDVLIRAGMIAVLAIFCYRVFHPFLNLMLWAMILAVTIYPLQCKLRSKFGNRDGLTATVIVLLAIAILLVPTYVIAASLAATMADALTLVRGGNLHVPPPSDAVAGWPLIGPSVHAIWQQAAVDLGGFTQQYAPQIRAYSLVAVSKVAGVGVGLLSFIAALILAGIFMAFGENGHRAAVKIFSRIAGPDRGPQIAVLCTATIRAVAQGVIGIAFIQAVLVGIGFMAMGVPAAGLLILAVLLVGIMQVPALVITLPVIGLVMSSHGVNASTIIFSVYVFIAGLSDNVLKPLMLGRGVSVPMPVILIGALGGMVTGGIIGLFIGPVLLAVGYELFWQWVEQQRLPVEPVAEPAGQAPA
ncbi:MAG: AI-2E family transporter [Allosphingosinicella sp.]